jgi:predicted nucleotidyltransferase
MLHHLQRGSRLCYKFIVDHDTDAIILTVKALYDYQATIAEEFDFQAGDVIAVTATPDDGWWIGELLDEARREEGRDVFPSNFVCLF